jgi:hypothetical protein
MPSSPTQQRVVGSSRSGDNPVTSRYRLCRPAAVPLLCLC